jgi:hypothetical protein
MNEVGFFRGVYSEDVLTRSVQTGCTLGLLN